MSTPLNRAALGLPTPPVRLVHLGLGAFHRAHQAWYTQHAETDPGRPEWGYASFTGRSAALADQLAPQDGLYTLVERSGDGDRYELISALAEARPADDVVALWGHLADPQVAVVTLTVTEAAYHLGPGLSFDPGVPAVAADRVQLAAAWSDGGIVWDEARPNVNYWEPWYLGLEPGMSRKPGASARSRWSAARARVLVATETPSGVQRWLPSSSKAP